MLDRHHACDETLSVGIPLEKNSAKVTSEARAHTSMMIVRTSANRPKAPTLARHAVIVATKCDRLAALQAAADVVQAGGEERSDNRNPAVSAEVYS